MISIPDPLKIQTLYWDSGISQGNKVSIAPTAAPPAMVAINPGKTQQMSVLVDPKRDSTPQDVFFMGVP
jgi:hypothetical protein